MVTVASNSPEVLGEGEYPIRRYPSRNNKDKSEKEEQASAAEDKEEEEQKEREQ